MGAALVVAGKDLRRRLRDRTAYIVGVVAPLVLAGLISVAFGGSGFAFSATFAVVDQDGGQLARAFVDDMLGDPGQREVVTTKAVSDRDEAVRLPAAPTWPPPSSSPPATRRRPQPANPSPLEVVRSADEVIGTDVAVAVAEGCTAKVRGAPVGGHRAGRRRRRQPRAAGGGGRSRGAGGRGRRAERRGRRCARRRPVRAGHGRLLHVLRRRHGRPPPGGGAEGGHAVPPARRPGAPDVAPRRQGAALVMGVASLGAMAIASTFLLRMSWGDPWRPACSSSPSCWRPRG